MTVDDVVAAVQWSECERGEIKCLADEPRSGAFATIDGTALRQVVSALTDSRTEISEMLGLIGAQAATIAELQEAVLRTAEKAMQDAYAVGKVRAALQLARSFVSIHETPWSLAILPDIDAALLETVDPPTEVR